MASSAMEQTDGYWIGRLSMALALAAKRGDQPSKEIVRDFLTTSPCTPELRDMLREELKT